jgi:phosphopantetheinyl transferase
LSHSVISVQIHVMRTGSAAAARNCNVLCPEEHKQTQSFVRQSDKVLFEQGRIQRRLVLGNYLNDDPASLVFTAGRFGKPAVTSTHAASVNFNTSHGTGVTAIAVVMDPVVAIGADIERIDRQTPESLWPQCLTAHELTWVRAAPPALRTRRFIRLWTCKEAIMKATGFGLQADPRLIGIDPESLEIGSLPPLLGKAAHYRLQASDLMNEFSLAVCIVSAKPGKMEMMIFDDTDGQPDAETVAQR